MARIDVPDGTGGEAVQAWQLRPELGSAVARMTHAAYQQSILPVRVRELARMRVAQLNQCVVCAGFRATSVTEHAEVDEAMYANVADYRSRDDYSAQERLAIEYAERFVVDHTNIDDAFMTRLRSEFTDAEVLDLSFCLAVFLGLGRMLNVLELEETERQDVP
jgi:AhpD family alkylhydroperoxidase